MGSPLLPGRSESDDRPRVVRGTVSPEREVPSHITRPPYAAGNDHPGWTTDIEVHDDQARPQPAAWRLLRCRGSSFRPAGCRVIHRTTPQRFPSISCRLLHGTCGRRIRRSACQSATVLDLCRRCQRCGRHASWQRRSCRWLAPWSRSAPGQSQDATMTVFFFLRSPLVVPCDPSA